MGECIKVTHAMGNVLLNAAISTKFPKEVGTRSFDEKAQAKIGEKFRLLFKKLKKSATKRNGSYLFGAFENWKASEISRGTMNAGGSVEMQNLQKETVYNLVDQDLEIEIKDLTGAEKSGIYWLCYLWAHPASPSCQSGGIQEDVVWPLVEMIGKTADLRKDIGLVTDGDDEYFGDSKPAEKKPETAPAA